jgi:hypothetical protein
MMHDKSPSVRCAALDGLLAPFLAVRRLTMEGGGNGMAEKIDLSSMEHVIAKFLKRIAESVVDVDGGVQEVAMELMLELLKGGFLDDVEEDGLWNLVNCRALAVDAVSDVVNASEIDGWGTLICHFFAVSQGTLAGIELCPRAIGTVRRRRRRQGGCQH